MRHRIGHRVKPLRLALAECLDSEFWVGKGGAVWSLAHPKIRPVNGLKGGIEDTGSLPVLGDFYDDYHLFVYTQTDDRDARDVLLADYYVQRSDNPTTYSATADDCDEEPRPVARVASATLGAVRVAEAPAAERRDERQRDRSESRRGDEALDPELEAMMDEVEEELERAFEAVEEAAGRSEDQIDAALERMGVELVERG